MMSLAIESFMSCAKLCALSPALVTKKKHSTFGWGIEFDLVLKLIESRELFHCLYCHRYLDYYDVYRYTHHVSSTFLVGEGDGRNDPGRK
jgi:hypothetical protein